MMEKLPDEAGLSATAGRLIEVGRIQAAGQSIALAPTALVQSAPMPG
jgi:hypothetical protein